MATIQSMTGFSRARSPDGAVSWELKSVNGKGLEVRLRLPPGHDRLEQAVRATIQKGFTRGNVQATLTLLRGAGLVAPVVNEAFLTDVAGLAKRLEDQFGCTPASADGLLALRGVLEVPEASDDKEARAGIDAAAIAVLEEAVAGLKAAREAEGQSLGTHLSAHLSQIEQLTLKAEADPSREPDAIRRRLSDQVQLLLDATPGKLDEGRLLAEAAILATKADIREEIDRLKTHVAAARDLLAEGGPLGRRLDFLSQEFNREANTLCSKANAAAVTAIGLELKVAVDQFREQVQNLE